LLRLRPHRYRWRCCGIWVDQSIGVDQNLHVACCLLPCQGCQRGKESEVVEDENKNGDFCVVVFCPTSLRGVWGSEYCSELCQLLTFWARRRLIVEIRVVKYVGAFWLCRLARKRHTSRYE
jgi:hypothetical protein